MKATLKYLLLMVFLFQAFFLFAQEPKHIPPPPPPPPSSSDEVPVLVKRQPRFPGCEDIAGTYEEKRKCADQKFKDFIYKHLEYPDSARVHKIEGIVIVSFKIDKGGNVKDIKVVKDIGGGCGEEAVRVIQLIPDKGWKWIPARFYGRPGDIMFNVPVKFELE
ncbi:MAG: energy transducer TonB [Bacteroidetes bacterium]|nr:MAG: energy transducer TonB [Bacteroidota bacterium]